MPIHASPRRVCGGCMRAAATDAKQPHTTPRLGVSNSSGSRTSRAPSQEACQAGSAHARVPVAARTAGGRQLSTLTHATHLRSTSCLGPLLEGHVGL
jgi:hypothetical protein